MNDGQSLFDRDSWLKQGTEAASSTHKPLANTGSFLRTITPLHTTTRTITIQSITNQWLPVPLVARPRSS